MLPGPRSLVYFVFLEGVELTQVQNRVKTVDYDKEECSDDRVKIEDGLTERRLVELVVRPLIVVLTNDVQHEVIECHEKNTVEPLRDGDCILPNHSFQFINF